MWIGGFLIVGAAAHAAIFMVRDYDPTIQYNNILDHVLRHRDAIVSHLNWACIFLGFHSFGLYIHNDTMSALGRPQDMFSDTAIQLQPIFAQWIQNTHASAPSSTAPGATTSTSLTWGGGDLLAVGGKVALLPIPLGITDFLVHQLHAFTIHVTVLILLKGVLFSRSSRLIPDKENLGFHFPCDGPRRGGTCQVSAWDHVFLGLFWMYNAISVVIFHFSWKMQSDVWGSISDRGVVTHITGGNFAQSSITINGWLRDFLWAQASQVIQSYGYLHMELIESIVWAHNKLKVTPTIQPRALSIVQGRAVGVAHYLLGGIATIWAFFLARILAKPSPEEVLPIRLILLILAIINGVAGCLDLQPRWKSSVSWFKNVESRLNHHFSGLFGVGSGHLVHVVIPESRGEHVRWDNFSNVLPYPQGLGSFLTGAFAHRAIFFIRDYNPEQNKDNVLARMLEHKEAIISHLSWASLFLGFHNLGLYVHNDVMLAFGTPEKQILIEPIFAQWIQSAHGKALYGFDVLLSSTNGPAFNAGQSIWLPGWLNAINDNSNSLFLTIGPGDFLVHHAIALGLHTTTLILVKGALDARGSKLMPDKKDFGYSCPYDGLGRGDTCDISAWDAFYLAIFWMLNTIGWVTFYWHWKHITLWQGNVAQFNESSTYLMGWSRDYLWLNSSQLINGYNPFGKFG
eukprot:Gb_11361 [translate_table: standard]